MQLEAKMSDYLKLRPLISQLLSQEALNWKILAEDTKIHDCSNQKQ